MGLALIAAGIEPTGDNGMHALRHFYASVLLDAGESINALAGYLGHADPASPSASTPFGADRADQSARPGGHRVPGDDLAPGEQPDVPVEEREGAGDEEGSRGDDGEPARLGHEPPLQPATGGVHQDQEQHRHDHDVAE